VPELACLLVYAIGMNSSSWPVRPPGRVLVTLLALPGYAVALWRRRSRERGYAG
jgi:hypothetical protein